MNQTHGCYSKEDLGRRLCPFLFFMPIQLDVIQMPRKEKTIINN